MNDIQNQDDLYLLVDEFYKKLLADEKISYIFTDVVKIKIEKHLLYQAIYRNCAWELSPVDELGRAFLG
ncbi:hypothetical protein WFZ85_13795 [Flavobacterium sp. j3]|uniref:Transposase n=1 Tax=Flavobacterium aureirubrum TaxID=3133147 RepID=A0ABU9N7N1_9FLAO